MCSILVIISFVVVIIIATITFQYDYLSVTRHPKEFKNTVSHREAMVGEKERGW